MIVKNFKYTREMLDIKQKDLTTLFKVTQSTISGWEIGKDTIPLRHLIEYANEYNLSLDYLFGLKSENEIYLPLTINLKTIGKNLRIIRKKNNLTQEEVAKFLNTVTSGYAHYENARNLIQTTFLYALTKIYINFSIDEILGRKK